MNIQTIFRGSVCSAGNTKIPIYATRGTIEGIKAYKGIGKMPEGLLKEVTVDQMFSIGNLDIRPFAISHDANEPSGFRMNMTENHWPLRQILAL